MPVAFHLPSPSGPHEQEDSQSDTGDYHPSVHTSGGGSQESRVPVKVRSVQLGAAVDARRKQKLVTTSSFSFEDGEVAGVLDAQTTDTFPSHDASPSDQPVRSNTVQSECSIVDHAAPAAGGAGDDDDGVLTVPAALAHPTTASYESAVASAAVHKLSVRELLRHPPPLSDSDVILTPTEGEC